MLRRFRHALWAFLVPFAGVAAPAQCDFAWGAGAPASGPLGSVHALLELPNGDLIAGGSFAIAGSTAANNIARWDGVAWHALGGGCSGTVRALARMPNGDVIAGGSFATAAGVPVNSIARWNGTTWQALGAGLDGEVNALQVLPNGDLAIGGSFLWAGGLFVRCLARWDGAAYHAYDTTFPVWAALSLAVLPNGTLVAGCDAPFYGLVQWNGTTWQAIPGLDPLLTKLPGALVPLANGDLLIGGRVPVNGVQHTLVRYDGVAMNPIDPPLTSVVAVGFANGETLAGGPTTLGSSVYAYNGTAWVSRNNPQLLTRALTTAAGQVVAGGNASATPNGASVLRQVGGTWVGFGAGEPPLVRDTVRLTNGDLVVGGEFLSLRGVAAANLARWNGTTWAPVGGGVNGQVWCLAGAPNGDLVVGGAFTAAGGAPAQHVARWNGQTWTTLGGGLTGVPIAIAANASGSVLVATENATIWAFQGLTWSQVTLGATPSVVERIVTLPNGDFALGGVFLGPQGPVGTVLYGNGVTTPLPWAGGVYTADLLVDRNGDLVAAGGGLRRWNGTAWNLLSPANNLAAIAELPDGTFVGAGGEFTAGGSTSCVFRIESTGPVPLGDVRGSARTIGASRTGDLCVGGNLLTAAGQVSVGFAQAQPPCPASVTSVGAGCMGSAGPVTLTTDQAPWTGASFTMVASGMTVNSAAVLVIGVLPLAVPLPGGAPGCSVFVDPLFYATFAPVGGGVTTHWDVPDSVPLVGLVFRAQVGGVEFGPTGIERLTSTNALQAVIGSL